MSFTMEVNDLSGSSATVIEFEKVLAYLETFPVFCSFDSSMVVSLTTVSLPTPSLTIGTGLVREEDDFSSLCFDELLFDFLSFLLFFLEFLLLDLLDGFPEEELLLGQMMLPLSVSAIQRNT